MALNHGSSGGVDCVDVRYVLSAFEHINKCKLLVRITVEGTEARPDLSLEVVALDSLEDRPEVRYLGSQRYQIGSHGPRTMEAAILQALYQLDAHFAAEELAKVNNK